MTLKISSYLLPYLGKRYEDDLRVIFDQWQKLHLGLDVLSNQKILKGIYLAASKYTCLLGPLFAIICVSTRELEMAH